MGEEVFGGAALALRRWRSTFSTALIFSFACLVTALILGDVLSQWAALRGGAVLREERAIVFDAYYDERGVTDTSAVLRDVVAPQIAARSGYTSVLRNLNVDDPDFAAGHPVLLVSGDEVDRLFPDLGLCSPAPCVSAGADMVDYPPTVSIAGHALPVARRLASGATWFDPNAAGAGLGQSLVINLPAEMLNGLDAYAKEEAVTRLVLMKSPRAQVNATVAAAAESNLHLVPQDVSVEQPRRFRDLMVTASMYIVALAAFMLLIVYAFAATSTQIVRQEIRGFVIRRAAGATPAHVTVRLATFLAVVVLVLPTLMCGALFLLGPPVARGAAVALAAAWTVYALLLFVARRMVLAERYLKA